MLCKPLVFIIVACAILGAVASNDDPTVSMPGVIDLTPKNAEKTIAKKDYLVEFYAPWCGWCKRLVPVWTELGALIGADHESVGIAKYDATQPNSDDIKTTYGVRGFPTILMIKRDGTVIRYAEDRTAETLFRWVKQITGATFKDNTPAAEDSAPATADAAAPAASSTTPGEVAVLTPDNFDKIVSDASKTVFVKFYAPWCGHCVRMADAWKELAKNLATVPDVVIAELDAAAHSQQAQTYGVRGFPSVKLFTKENKSGDITFKGARDVASFRTFLKENGIALP